MMKVLGKLKDEKKEGEKIGQETEDEGHHEAP